MVKKLESMLGRVAGCCPTGFSYVARSVLVRILGWRGALLHGDPGVADRWRWLRRRLPRTRNKERLLDLGCGSGAIAIACAKRGYDVLGISWNQEEIQKAKYRALLCRAENAAFEVFDLRKLQNRSDLKQVADIVVCFETVEHVLDDFGLFTAIATCLKPGGRLMLTTPYYGYRAMTKEEEGPFLELETGGHVRRGYSPAMLWELCMHAGLWPEEISYCMGYMSQKTTWLMRMFYPKWWVVGWLLSLFIRPFIVILDPLVTSLLGWPKFSICLCAYKPRRDLSAATWGLVAAKPNP
jgi:SAM-dependent methyltransferase